MVIPLKNKVKFKFLHFSEKFPFGKGSELGKASTEDCLAETVPHNPCNRHF